MLVLPSDHPKAVAPKIALTDLLDEQFIEFSNETNTLYKQTMDLWARTGAMPRINHKAENGLAILGLVASGFGSAILPNTLSQI